MGWNTAFGRKGPAEAGTPTSQIKIDKALGRAPDPFFEQPAEVFELPGFLRVVEDRFGPPLEVLDVPIAGVVERADSFAQARLKTKVNVQPIDAPMY